VNIPVEPAGGPHDPGNYRFCPLCAAGLVTRADGDRERLLCPSCGFIYYHNPVPAAGGLIVRDGAVCLVRRAVDPRRGYWSLPAGFMEYNEPSRECARREIAEETGLDVVIEDVLGVYSAFDDPRQHAVLVVYWAREVESRPLVPGDDADAAGFFRAGDIPGNIAFLAHRQALKDALASPRFSIRN
jgi:8-oxo-dGTP diphosphatase